MEHIFAKVIENDYIRETGTTFTRYLNSRFPTLLLEELENVSYFNILIGYGQNLTPEIDLFQYFDKDTIDRLANDKNTVMFFDRTFEGYSEEIEILSKSFESSCRIYNINPKKIFLLTGNLETVKFKTDINVTPIFLLSMMFQNINEMHIFDAEDIVTSKNLCYKKFKKLVLSLSRRNREHRVWGHFMLSRSDIFDECIVSQDKLDDFQPSPFLLERLNVTIDDFNNFKKKLPFFADGDTFHINNPTGHLSDLHFSTAFSIVNETLCVNQNETSLFYSEKILKPMFNFQPMIIWGQKGINKRLPLIGFKTYESYFDLSFDDEPDDILRYQKLLVSASDVVSYLKSLTRDQQIEWRYKNSELLSYNRNRVFNDEYLIVQILEIILKIKKLIQ